MPADNSDGPPSVAGLHELSAPGVHGPHVAMRPVGSYPTFSPLPRLVAGRLFSSALPDPRGPLPVKKRVALCCPDFPPAPPLARSARGRPSGCLPLKGEGTKKTPTAAPHRQKKASKPAGAAGAGACKGVQTAACRSRAAGNAVLPGAAHGPGGVALSGCFPSRQAARSGAAQSRPVRCARPPRGAGACCATGATPSSRRPRSQPPPGRP